MSNIIYGDYYLPSNLVSAKNILMKSTKLTDEFIMDFLEKSHIDKIAIEVERSEVYICMLLMDKLIKEKKILKNEINYIIYINVLESSKKTVCTPYLIQKQYNLTNCTVIILDIGCGATLQAITLADALIQNKNANKVLIISSILGIKGRYIKTTIVGDGAGILLLGNEGESSKVLDTISITDGEYSYNEFNEIRNDINKFNIIKKGSELIKELVNRNKVDIKKIVPLSVNYYASQALAEFLDVPIEKLYLKNIPKGGHLGDVDVIRNYVDIIADKELHKGDKIILYGLGYRNKIEDITYYAVLLEI